ncbi:MAG: YcaQ family DNA glycosylase [Myxococcales bacterium]|nr:YcaQ family DNA glycosylase [Myxococcales bacterium]
MRRMIRLTPDEARAYLLGQTGLCAVVHPDGPPGARALLAARRCIQLDPIDRIGTNADLVAFARVDGLGRGDVHHGVDGHAFEHFAKERCLLPASAFPAYRARAVQTPWWRLTERLKRLDEGVVEAVLAEVTARGPLTASEMGDHGRVEALDWSGWKGTAKAATMALEVLWTRCQVVVRGRNKGARVYDLPERAIPHVAEAEGPSEFLRWALRERIEAAGLLPEISGPWWSMLSDARKDGTVDALLKAGEAVRVQVDGNRRTYLAPAGFCDRQWPEMDDRVRILGPLDPLIWYRPLIEHVFGFEYLWEVYKPADQRRWGYYVCPLLHRGRFVGRFEGRFVDGEVVVENLWREDGVPFPEAEFRAALERHAACLSR